MNRRYRNACKNLVACEPRTSARLLTCALEDYYRRLFHNAYVPRDTGHHSREEDRLRTHEKQFYHF
jgi:hypothetical protein